MGIFQVEVILGGNFPSGNCPGGSYRWWELSGWKLSWVGIFFDGNFPGGELSGGNHPGGSFHVTLICPSLEILGKTLIELFSIFGVLVNLL